MDTRALLSAQEVALSSQELNRKLLKEYRHLWRWTGDNGHRLNDQSDTEAQEAWSRMIEIEKILTNSLSREALVAFRK